MQHHSQLNHAATIFLFIHYIQGFNPNTTYSHIDYMKVLQGAKVTLYVSQCCHYLTPRNSLSFLIHPELGKTIADGTEGKPQKFGCALLSPHQNAQGPAEAIASQCHPDKPQDSFLRQE